MLLQAFDPGPDYQVSPALPRSRCNPPPPAAPRPAAGSSEDEGEDSEEGSEGEEEEEEDEGLGAAARWKSGLLERAAALFSTRAADLAGFIYGSRAVVEVCLYCLCRAQVGVQAGRWVGNFSGDTDEEVG
jgi:hypothetical protein